MARIEVETEVAGTVWKRVAAVGDALDEGAPILIVESMKMEIPLLAPAAGQLIEFCVDEEDPVEEGQILAVIET